jgi:hypothetical protein
MATSKEFLWPDSTVTYRNFGWMFSIDVSSADGSGRICEMVIDHPIPAATSALGGECQKTPLAARDRCAAYAAAAFAE